MGTHDGPSSVRLHCDAGQSISVTTEALCVLLPQRTSEPEIRSVRRTPEDFGDQVIDFHPASRRSPPSIDSNRNGDGHLPRPVHGAHGQYTNGS